MKLEIRAALELLGGRALLAHRLPAALHVVTDTRALAPGDTFLALQGERFDGHAFVGQALERGAAACVVSDTAALPAGIPAILVQDPLAAYLALAGAARDRLRGKVVAISGSAGKTTTKSFLLQLLHAAGVPAVATPENENNEIGVSKFLLGLEAGDARIAIVEMGARKYRDLDALVAAAKPDVAALTNIGEAHLEIFGSRQRLADTKWALFERGARAVLNLHDAESRRRAETLAVAPVWFGSDHAPAPPGARAFVLRDHRTLAVENGNECVVYPVNAGVPGEHNRRNLAAAFAAADALGIAPELLAPHTTGLHMPAGRYEVRNTRGGARLVFDAYNASMSGTLATLAAFAHEPARRRIAVLGSMAELGADAPDMHRRVGDAAAAANDVVLAGGEFAADIARGAYAAGAPPERVVVYAQNADALAWLRANVGPGDAILLKGSRKYKMEEIADGLAREATV
ncbi:MAG: UDP-N-acetylmuramoyl-tripeptide--D-alanyl-D-alanine ligase [Candidatus Velthaea sp.]